MTLLHLGAEIVNTEHIVMVKFQPARPEEPNHFDEDYGKYRTLPARGARLDVVLTALEVREVAEDLPSSYHLAAASRSQTVTLYNDQAERAWEWFERKAVNDLVPAHWPEDD